MPKVTLDAEAFKVLASDTRLNLLKSLDARPKTVSELARELELNKATVFEHLQHLITGELVKKQEREGRKWVYYKLTWKGTSLLHPENTTVLVLLSFAMLGSAGAMVELGNWLKWWGLGALHDDGGSDGEDFGADGTDEAAPPDENDSGFTSADSDGSDGSDGGSDGSGTDGGNQTETALAERAGGDLGGDSASDGGQTTAFFENPDFWMFAFLALVATALVVAAQVIRTRARRGQT